MRVNAATDLFMSDLFIGDVMKEVEETQLQCEDDIDTEIENLRHTFDDKFTSSRETTLKLKGTYIRLVSILYQTPTPTSLMQVRMES